MLPDAAAGPAPLPSEDDDGGWSWLVTFSDLVLQLFGFVLVAAVVGGAATRGEVASPVAPPAAAEAPAPEAAAPRALAAPSAAPPADAGPDAAVARAVADADALPAPRQDVRDRVPVPPAVAAAGPVGATAPAPEMSAGAPPAPAASQPSPPAGRLAGFAGYVEHLVALQPELGAHVAREGSAVVVTVGDVAGFASGSAEPSRLLAPLLAELRDIVRASDELRVEVAGHTDDVPIRTPLYRSNLELSLARAARVAHELAGDDPAVRARVFASGHGAERPLASNADAAGRARNRRVEIRLALRG